MTAPPAASLGRYYALRAIDSNVDSLVTFIVPVLIYQGTGSVAWSGLALAAEWVPRLAGLPMAGPLVDRFGVRGTYLVAETARTLAAMVAVAAVTTASPLWTNVALVTVALVTGLGSDLAFVAGEKAVRVLATPAALPRAQSVLGGIDQTALVLGSLVGGVLVTALSTFALAAVVLFCAASVTLLLRSRSIDEPAARDTPVNLWRPLWAGVRWIAGHSLMRTVVAQTMAINLLAGLTIAATPAVLIGRFGRSAAAVSVLWVAGGLASLLVLAVTPRLVRRFGLVRVGVLSAVTAGAAITACAVAGNAAVFIALTVCFLALVEVFAVFIRTVRARVVPLGLFGTVSGVVVLLNFTTFPVAGLLLAAASRWQVPVQSVYGACGLGFLLLSGWLATRLLRLTPALDRAESTVVAPAAG